MDTTASASAWNWPRRDNDVQAMPGMGIICLDRGGRVLSVDPASAGLARRPDHCIGRHWRSAFPDIQSPALEFAVACPGASVPANVEMPARRLRVRVNETEGGLLLVWQEASAPQGAGPACREPSGRLCFFTVRVTSGRKFTFDAFDAACEHATGMCTQEVHGRTPHQLLPREVADHLTERWLNCVATGRTVRCKDMLPMPGGLRCWKTVLVPVRDSSSGRITRLVAKARDITHRAGAALNRQPGPLQAVLDALSAPALVLDANGAVIALNAACRNQNMNRWRLGANYLAACEAGEFGHPRPNEIADGLRAMLRGEREELHIDCRSEGRWLQLRATPFDCANLRYLVLMHEDVTEARLYREAVRQLPRRLMQVRDEEHRRIARELHDSTAQNLVGASLAAERAMGLGMKLTPPGAQALTEAQGLIQQSLREIRTLSYLLHPPLLEEAGLPHALACYVEGLARRSSRIVELRVCPELSRRHFTYDIEMALFRIAQEAVGNAYRHSGGTKIDVGLDLASGPRGSEVVLTVSDNGIGPSLAVLRALASPSFSQKSLGVGLMGMRERIIELGGRLTLRTGHHGGTELRAAIPLPARY